MPDNRRGGLAVRRRGGRRGECCSQNAHESFVPYRYRRRKNNRKRAVYRERRFARGCFPQNWVTKHERDIHLGNWHTRPAGARGYRQRGVAQARGRAFGSRGCYCTVRPHVNRRGRVGAIAERNREGAGREVWRREGNEKVRRGETAKRGVPDPGSGKDRGWWWWWWRESRPDVSSNRGANHRNAPGFDWPYYRQSRRRRRARDDVRDVFIAQVLIRGLFPSARFRRLGANERDERVGRRGLARRVAARTTR